MRARWQRHVSPWRASQSVRPLHAARRRTSCGGSGRGSVVVAQSPAPDLLGLAGTVTVVTGGAQGIGEGIVELFVDAGSSVVVADINGEGAERVAASVRDRGGVAT